MTRVFAVKVLRESLAGTVFSSDYMSGGAMIQLTSGNFYEVTVEGGPRAMG
jgi:hypothetical protein